MYWIYVLRESITGQLYKGSTSNLERRLKEHHVKKPGYVLIYQEIFETKHEAQARELFLKTGDGRRWLKQRLIDPTRASS
jgi:putative endonuclease